MPATASPDVSHPEGVRPAQRRALPRLRVVLLMRAALWHAAIAAASFATPYALFGGDLAAGLAACMGGLIYLGALALLPVDEGAW